jgi:CBS domain-containing protein
MRVRDIMRPRPFTILSTDTLGNAQRSMMRARIRHLPVMAGGHVAGMLTERDVLGARARADGDDTWWKIPVARVMRTPVQTAGPEDSVSEVAGRMALAKIGALPIVERGALLGIITVSDVLNGELQQAMEPTPASDAIVADAMTSYPCTVGPELRLAAAVAKMVEHHVRHLPVVDRSGALVGILSEQDVRTAIGDPMLYRGRGRAVPSTARRHPACRAESL